MFRIGADGTGYALLREFAGGEYDGRTPYGNLTLDGSTLYGTTAGGGDSDYGTVFTMNADGTGFTLLHEFAGGVDDGSHPRCSLTLDGSTLYGMTRNGGDDDRGTVFRMNADGTGYALLHEFTGPLGANPHGSLTLSGTTMYGMTRYGGDSNYGTVFKINADGTGFMLLHEFTDGADDGRDPHGNLTLIGSALYGMTRLGGDNGYGTLFRMNADGTDFTLLHEFTGTQGVSPYGSLTRYGTTLYGMTMYGGAYEGGIIFSLGLDPQTIPGPFSLLFFGTGVVGIFGFASRRRICARFPDGPVSGTERQGQS